MPAKASNDVALIASSSETSIADLQRELQRVRLERDDLARDVEALCMSGADPTGISTSSVVSERIRIQDEQLADCGGRLDAALADASSLREDLAALRESKRIADRSWRSSAASTTIRSRASRPREPGARCPRPWPWTTLCNWPTACRAPTRPPCATAA